MAASRLSEAQKGEIVLRFRDGESSQSLANSFGCSSATITRAVKAALSSEEYETLKGQRGRRERGSEDPQLETVPAAVAQAVEAEPEPVAVVEAVEAAATQQTLPFDDPARTEAAAVEAQDPDDAAEPAGLAVDDADDFGDDDEADDGIDDDGSEPEPVAVIPVLLADDTVSEPQPLQGADLPASAYMLVDKTVELQARPLSDLPELGRLPAGEEQRQALVIYVNPRQAKRQCGRTQRVIKMPDLRLLERTAPYLLAQGISRIVIEGSLYALPGS